MIVLFVLAAGDVVQPLLVVEVLSYDLPDTFFELKRWFPTKFFLKFGRVDGIRHFVSGTISYISDELKA